MIGTRAPLPPDMKTVLPTGVDMNVYSLDNCTEKNPRNLFIAHSLYNIYKLRYEVSKTNFYSCVNQGSQCCQHGRL